MVSQIDKSMRVTQKVMDGLLKLKQNRREALSDVIERLIEKTKGI